MKKAILLAIAAIVVAACTSKTSKDVATDDTLTDDTLASESLTSDSVVVPDNEENAGKEGFPEDVENEVIETIRTFYEDYVFYGKDDLNIEETVEKYCTKELAKKLKDDYEYEGEGYAIWDFRGKDWGPGDSMAKKVDDIKSLGGGNYRVEYRDGDQKMSCVVTVVVKDGKILFDDVETLSETIGNR